MRHRKFYVLSALLTGVLLACAWPAIGGLTPLIFFAWVPLLFAEDRFSQAPPSDRPRHFMPYVMIALAVWNALTTWWLYCVSESEGTKLFTVIGPNVGNILVMSVPWLLMRITRRMFGGHWARLAIIVFWTAFERFHMHWDLSWPWLTLGNVFANDVAWVQWYECTGTLGGTVWVLAANLAILSVVRNAPSMNEAFSGRAARRRSLVAIAIIALPIVGSLFRYTTFKEKGDPVEVVMVQPDIDPYKEKFGGVDPMAQLDRMLAQAAPLITPNTALVVMPETALQEQAELVNENGVLLFKGLWENELDRSRSVERIRAFLVQHPGVSLLSGMSSSYLYKAGEKYPYTARPLGDSGRGFDSYNAALLVRPDGSTEVYHKSKLVPGVELMPFEDLLGPLGSIALDLGGTTGSLGTQEEREVLVTDSGKVRTAPVICYESIYGDHVAAHVRNGANIITIMTNDGWWADSPGYEQHLAYGRLRAVETRRSIARCANTGISCMVDQRGDIHQLTDWWVPATERCTLLARNDITFFVWSGDLVGKGAEGLSAILLLLMTFVGVRRWLTWK